MSNTPIAAQAGSRSLIAALYGADSSHLVSYFDAEGKPVADDTATDGPLYISSATERDVAFVFGYAPDMTLEEAKAAKVPPTAILKNEAQTILIWAFDGPQDADAVAPLAQSLRMASIDDLIPLPSHDWNLGHCDPTQRASLAALNEAYLALDEEPEAVEGEEPQADDAVRAVGEMYAHAKVMRAYRESDYRQPVTVTVGAGIDAKHWKPETMPLGYFLAKLVTFKPGKKDGSAWVAGAMVAGQRLKNNVKSLHFITLDVDVGTPSAVVDAALTKLGCAAVRHTSHSSFKTTSEFKKDKIGRYANGRDIDTALIREFLAQDQKWDASIAAHATYEGMDHTERGLMVFIKHPPIPKHRVVIPLASPYVIADEGATQKEATDKWAKVIDAMGAKLGLPYDRACIDPSRLYLFPRFDPSRPYEAAIWGGDLYSWRTLDLDNKLEQYAAGLDKGKSKSVTPEGRDLGRWSIKRAVGFQIQDVIEAHCPDRIRGGATHGKTIECPNDESHSNPGDTSDTGCFAVNAGEGVSEVFTISCRHEACRSRTNLDMLGKMIKDGWFDKDVLEDESFNAVILDDEGKEVAPSPAAQKIIKQDAARADYKEAIAALTEDSTEEEFDKALDTVIDAKLSEVAFEKALKTLNKATGMTVGVVRKAIAAKKAKRDKTATGKTTDPKGRIIFPFNGEFNFDELCNAGVTGLKRVKHSSGAPTFSQVNGNPVRLAEVNGKLTFVSLDHDALWSELCELVTMVRRTEQGDGARGKFDKDAAKHIYEQAYKRLPIAPEIIRAPIFLADGAMITQPGFYPDHDILMIDTGLTVPPVSDKPTKQEAEASANWIKTELLDDFSFYDVDDAGNKITDNSPSMAAAFAMLLTPIMRRMIDGLAPLHFVHKPRPQTGGTLLASLSIWIHEGMDGGSGSLNYTPSEEEMEKRLVGALLSAATHLFFDNVKKFSNEVLVRALTQLFIGGRILGKSQIFQVANNFQWLATGNNTKMSEDMRRRVNWIRLNPETSDLNARDFTHPDLKKFVGENRGLALYHLMTIVKYWQAKKCPEFTERSLASFEDWSRKVGGVLEAVGITGFLQAKAPITIDVEDTGGLEFLIDFKKAFDVGSGQALEDVQLKAQAHEWRVWTGRNDDEKKQRVADTLGDVIGWPFAHDGKNYLFEAFRDKDGKARFRVIEIKPKPKPDDAATGGEAG